MTDKKTMQELLLHAVNKTAPANFSSTTVKEALLEEMRKWIGNSWDFERHKIDLFEILSQALSEKLPKDVLNAVGMFSDSMRVQNNQRVSFLIKEGHQRAKQFITRATPSGVYETFRLDRRQIELFPVAYGGAATIDFERYLAGLEDLMDSYDIITQGLVDAVFKEIMKALMASWDDTGRPAANRVWANNFDDVAMMKLVNVVAAYGDPVIFTTREFAAEMKNAVEFRGTVKISDEDMLDIRRQGFIGMYRGTPVVALPQSFEDEMNTKLTFNPRFAFVIPRGNENIVKVVYEGDAYINEFVNRDNSREIHGYQKFAVGVVSTPNYWGMYYNNGIDAGGHEDIPQPM